MTSSVSRTIPQDPILLLNAYLDGELDPINALEMERRLAADPMLAGERERLETLRRLLREQMPREQPSAVLRARIQKATGTQPAVSPPSWRALAASIAFAVIVSSSATWLLLNQPRADGTADAVLAAHIRGLMAPSPFDVASSDSHTVKPWFNGRISQSPRVIDLAGEGFSLAGGRVDVVGQEPAPTLVYRRRQHVISLTALDAAKPADAAPMQTSVKGYNIVRWAQNGVTYLAVSDLNTAELEEFANRFRSGK